MIDADPDAPFDWPALLLGIATLVVLWLVR